MTEQELIDIWERLHPGQRAAHEFHTGHKPAPPTLGDVLNAILDRIEER